ncbi:MAG: tetratricopeptide repeat protein [Terracidiphilus sp.]|jgi:TPR repeat protein
MQAYAQTAPNQDPQVALVEQQAQQGSAQAQSQLGYWYRYGHQGLSSMNLPQAALWLTKAAQQGYAPAQEQLADIYYAYQTGQNYTQAMYWYQKAVAQGANAMSAGGYYASYLAAGRWTLDVEKIGWMYLNGLGVTKNQSEAISWLNKILALDKANASKPGSMDDLIGRLYLSGLANGTDRANDPQQARAWLQKAANLGNQDAMNALAQLNAQSAPPAQPTPAPQQATPQQGICAAVYTVVGSGGPYGSHYYYGAAWSRSSYADALSGANSELMKFIGGANDVDPRQLPGAGGQYAATPAEGSGCTYAHGAVAGALKIAPGGCSMFNSGCAAGTSTMGPGIYDKMNANFADSTDAAASAAISACQTNKAAGGDIDHEVCNVIEQW